MSDRPSLPAPAALVSWERRLAGDPISRARWAERVRHYRGRAG